jgi:hypothetical protein
VAGVQDAGVDGVLHLEGRHHGARGQHVELQLAAGHLVDALGVVLRELVEDVLGRPGRLELHGHGLRPRDLRRGDDRGAADGGGLQELAARRLGGAGIGHGLLRLARLLA